jgi:hypothetical protein
MEIFVRLLAICVRMVYKKILEIDKEMPENGVGY